MFNGKVALGILFSIILLAGSAWAQAIAFQPTMVLQTSTTATGQAIEFPLFRNQITAFQVEIAPGGQSGRHMHPAPMFLYVIQGQLTYEVDGQSPRLYEAGQAFVEGVRVWHNAANRGSVPLKFVAALLGEEGVPTTIRP